MEEMNSVDSVNFGDIGSTASSVHDSSTDTDLIDFLYKERVRDWNMRRLGAAASGSGTLGSGNLTANSGASANAKPSIVPKLKLGGLGSGVGPGATNAATTTATTTSNGVPGLNLSGLVSRSGFPLQANEPISSQRIHPSDEISPPTAQPTSSSDDKKKSVLGVPKLNLGKVEAYSESSVDQFQQPLAAPRGERASAQVGVYIERAVVVEGVRGRLTPRDESRDDHTAMVSHAGASSSPAKYTHTFGVGGSGGSSGAVGLYIEHAIVVFSCTRGGPAERSGKLRAGDVLLRVDGRSCVNGGLANALRLLSGEVLDEGRVRSQKHFVCACALFLCFVFIVGLKM